MKIEKLTIEEVRQMASEEMTIKEHDCFFVDFKNAFGFSVLVFKNNKHVYFANDYQLHHNYIVSKSGLDGLKKYYIESLNKKLYTDVELMEKVTSYEDYEKKSYFLRNYYIMQFDYVSMFYIGEKQKKELEESRKGFDVVNPISFCYVKDENIVKTQRKFLQNLENSFNELKNSDEIFREMISCELSNHEACVTCDYTDALNALGLNFENLTEAQQKIVKEELKKQIANYY